MLRHSRIPYGLVDAKTLTVELGKDMPVMCVPPCFTVALDIDSSEYIGSHTAAIKFVLQASRGRQCGHSMHGNDVEISGATAQL